MAVRRQASPEVVARHLSDRSAIYIFVMYHCTYLGR
jgi:hypothetical protein